MREIKRKLILFPEEEPPEPDLNDPTTPGPDRLVPSDFRKEGCNQCVFALLQDEGYSNYTVENTVFRCMKGLHPDDGFDFFYGDNEKLHVGRRCTGFDVGEPVRLDVDREDPWPSDPRQRLYYTAWGEERKIEGEG